MANPQTASLSVADEFVQKIEQKNRKDRIIQLVPVFVLVGLYLVFAAVAPGFASLENLITMLGQTALPLTVALGITFVILTGCIDLSVDGVMSLGGCAVSMLVMNNMTSLSLGIIGVLASVAVCALIGFCIGLIHVKARIPSFMVSYGFSGIAAGVAMAVTGAVSPTIMDEGFRNLALSNFLGIPYTAWISFAVFAVAYIMQEYTAFGRYLFAVGNDESIPKVIGVNTQTVKLKAFAWSGALIGLAGILGAARIGMGTTLIGKNNLFPAMTAVVLGGTSLSGGKGGQVQTLIGCFMYNMLLSGLNMVGITSYFQDIVFGLLMIAAIYFTVDRSDRHTIVK